MLDTMGVWLDSLLDVDIHFYCIYFRNNQLPFNYTFIFDFRDFTALYLDA